MGHCSYRVAGCPPFPFSEFIRPGYVFRTSSNSLLCFRSGKNIHIKKLKSTVLTSHFVFLASKNALERKAWNWPKDFFHPRQLGEQRRANTWL